MKVLKSFKRLMGMAVVAIALTSCFKYGNSENYTLVANFEYGSDLTLRPDSTYYAEKGFGIGFNYLAFCHNVDPATYEFLGGFRISAQQGQYDPEPKEETEVQQEVLPLDMTWRAHSIKGVNTYMVHYMSAQKPSSDIEFLLPTTGTCTMKLCQVTNTGKVAEEIASKFQRGDKLTLVATGYKDGQMTGKAEFELADYTQNDKSGQPKDSIVSKWTNFDLSALQVVDKINFALVSTKSIPMYFCLDNVVADIAIEY